MEGYNLIRFDEDRITIKYETDTLVYETQKNPHYVVGTEYIDFEGDRYFLVKKKS